jgi:dTDP-4-amino-4,6-dideoxygalactose transaminase
MSRIYLSPPHMGPDERALLLDAFDSNWVAPLGPHVNAFEAELAARTGTAHAAALSSGTAALHLALQIVGVGPGDTVLVPTLTFIASASPVRYLGAEPVFIDSERSTWNMDAALVEEALRDGAQRGKLPKAVVAVDLFGQCADYDALVPVCARYDVPLIEDAAEALGASWRGRPAGSFGRMAVLSFNGNKIITTSGGGALLGDGAGDIERARHLATQAREPAPHYEHAEIGYNYRLSNLLAAVGRGQLRVLDERMAARRAHHDAYAQTLGQLPGVTLIPRDPRGDSNCWLTVLQIDPRALGTDRETIRQHLTNLEIEARPVWKPMHLQPAFAGALTYGGSVAEELFDRGLCLPSGSSLSDADRGRVIDAVRSVVP